MLRPSVLPGLSGEGRFLIASCGEGQYSLESPQLRHGLFTYHLLRGLLKDGDRDGDGRVGVAELFSYVSAAVSRDARQKYGHEQTPWTSAVYNEDVILSTVRRKAPSTEYSRSRMVVSRLISSSDSSRAFRWGSRRAWSHSRNAVVGPMPYRYRSEMCVGLSDGKSTPMIRGMRTP